MSIECNKLEGTQLAREFEMDVDLTNETVGMQIYRDRSKRQIWCTQMNYLRKILWWFNIQDCKPISTLSINVKLFSSMRPGNKVERMEMCQVLYASAVGSLIFIMVCTKTDIAQVVGEVCWYMAKRIGVL